MTERLPLFPLGTALFPGLVLPLNVFEAAYRAMMRDLLDAPRRTSRAVRRRGDPGRPRGGAQRRGLPDRTAVPDAARRPGSATTRSTPFHAVGCVADAATHPRARGRHFEVLATGTTRFRLLSVDASGPFLTAELEELPEEPGDEAGALAEGVLRAFRAVPEAAGGRPRAVPGHRRGPARRPLGGVLPGGGRRRSLDTPAKQRLLQAPDTASRLPTS